MNRRELLRDDDALLAEVRRSLDEFDPPPASLRDMAVRALTWDTDLAALALLSHDSVSAEAGLRSLSTVRDLVFEYDGVSIELELCDHPDGILVRGEIDPVPQRVVFESPGRADVIATSDAFGRFEVVIAASSARVVVDTDAGRIRTELIDLHT